MEYTLQYGTGNKTFTLPENVQVDLLEEHELATLADMQQGVLYALNNPMDIPPLSQMVAPKTVAIAVSDETSLLLLKKLLPALVGFLLTTWPKLKLPNITIVLGGGLLHVPELNELINNLPARLRKCNFVENDANQGSFIHFGVTSYGTSVELNSAFGMAEYKIAVGQINPHQLAGFSGGAVEAVIACASAQMIQHNYSLMLQEEAQVGIIETNPVRLDLNEAGELAGIDMAVNVVLNSARKAVAVFAGKPTSVVKEGSKIAAALYGVECSQPYDIVIASCGDVTKDTCLYRAQKGLRLASYCCKKGGKLMLLAQCPQGIGDAMYEDYVQKFTTPHEQMEEFERNGFRMGAHKAFLFSRTLISYDVAFVSDLEEAILKQCHLHSVDLQAKLNEWVTECLANGIQHPRIALIPSAHTTYFYQKK